MNRSFPRAEHPLDLIERMCLVAHGEEDEGYDGDVERHVVYWEILGRPANHGDRHGATLGRLMSRFRRRKRRSVVSIGRL